MYRINDRILQTSEDHTTWIFHIDTDFYAPPYFLNCFQPMWKWLCYRRYSPIQKKLTVSYAMYERLSHIISGMILHINLCINYLLLTFIPMPLLELNANQSVARAFRHTHIDLFNKETTLYRTKKIFIFGNILSDL